MKYLLIKCLFLFSILNSSNFWCQSKKTQIENLYIKVDSLNLELKNNREIQSKQTNQHTDSIKRLKQELEKLDLEINNLKQNNLIQKKENSNLVDTLKIINQYASNLEAILKLKLDSLNRIKNFSANERVLKTNQFAGFYEYGNKDKSTNWGSILVYPETDSTILFYLQLLSNENHFGELYARAKVIDNKAFYENISNEMGLNCQFEIILNPNGVNVRTTNENYECGFGNWVFADGDYLRKNNLIQDYFIDGSGTNVYFSKTKPEDF